MVDSVRGRGGAEVLEDNGQLAKREIFLGGSRNLKSIDGLNEFILAFIF